MNRLLTDVYPGMVLIDRPGMSRDDVTYGVYAVRAVDLFAGAWKVVRHATGNFENYPEGSYLAALAAARMLRALWTVSGIVVTAEVSGTAHAPRSKKRESCITAVCVDCWVNSKLRPDNGSPYLPVLSPLLTAILDHHNPDDKDSDAAPQELGGEG